MMLAQPVPPEKLTFLVREIPQYFPFRISLMTVYRWIESGQLDAIGQKYFQRVTRESLLKKISQF